MARSALKSFDTWLGKLLSYPGIDKKDLLKSKSVLIAVLVAMLVVILITAGLLIADRGLKTLISYGIVLLSGYIVILAAILLFTRAAIITGFIANVWFIIITFVFILKLGGIQHSAGLVLVGLSTVLTSYNSAKPTIILMALYVVTVIVSGIMHPWLTTPEEMTPEVNNTMFVVNIIWMSVYVLIGVLSYLRQSVELEQVETRRMKELDKAKTRIFTNITHEFRTPLTLIMGMADLIKKEPQTWADKGTDNIKKSGTNLLHLINQMLDLSKLEAGAMPVHLVQADIIRHIRYLKESFHAMVAKKSIDLLFVAGEKEFFMDYDTEKLTYIVNNLISNAIRHSPEYSMVSLELDVLQNDIRRVCITVRDNGLGIPEEKLQYIFDRFYRVDDSDAGEGIGSGLGLAITREMVNLLGGQITADSRLGKGTEFKVFIPVSNTAPVKNENDPGTPNNLEVRDLTISGESMSGLQKIGSNDKPILLLVEDNDDVVGYLTAILTNDYQVYVAANGYEGLTLAIEKVPDIIISDIMMPVMDGIEMLGKVKSDMRTSHIPVVMLTARADVTSRVSGIERGAEAYLPKPFNEKELQAVLKNLIASRRKLQEHYSANALLDLKNRSAGTLDDQFLQKILSLMDENLDNDEFGIVELCKAMGMSRAQTYRKFKTLTNKTLHDYLRSYRLNKAKLLLLSRNLNVSEVAYRTGFKNVSHFCRIFTEEFGKSPSEITN